MLESPFNNFSPFMRPRRPAWVIPGAALDLDYANGRYFRGYSRTISNISSFVRSGARTATGADGAVYEFGTGVRRIVPGRGLRVTAGAVNKCEAFTAPSDLTGLTKTGDAAASLTVVDDSDNMPAWLVALTGGMVYKLDNSAGNGDAFVGVLGQTGNTNTHTISVLARSEHVVGRFGLGVNAVMSGGIAGGYIFEKVTLTPTNTSNNLYFRAVSGSIIYFALPQLTETSEAVDYIPTSGTAASAGADQETFDLGLSGGVWTNLGGIDPAGGVTILCEADWAGGTNGFPALVSLDSGSGNRREIFRASSNLQIRSLLRWGAVDQITAAGPVDPGGFFKVAAKYKGGSTSICLNGGSVTTATGGTDPPPASHIFFGYGDNGQRDDWWIRRLTLIPGAVSDAQLQELSS